MDLPSDLSQAQARLVLVFITIVAIALRSYHLGADLWLDEISPIVDYGKMPFVQVMGSYLRTNNHLLNTAHRLAQCQVVKCDSQQRNRLAAIARSFLNIALVRCVVGGKGQEPRGSSCEFVCVHALS